MIRPAADKDRPAIAALQAASWRTAYAGVLDPAYLAAGLAHDLGAHWRDQPIGPQDVVLVAEEDGDLAGFIAVWGGDPPHIDNLHVDPARRSRGLGARLMRAAARTLAERGRDSAHLWVVSSNTRAIAFYRRLGGEITGEKRIDLYGTPSPATRIDWSSLAPLLTDPPG